MWRLMAAASIISALLLSVAGITGDLATLLVGKTFAQAAADLDTLAGLIAAKQLVQGGALLRYVIDGQTGETSIDQIAKARELIKSVARPSGAMIITTAAFVE